MIPHSKPNIVKDDFLIVEKTLFSGMISANNLNCKFKQCLEKYLSKEFVSLFSSGSQGLFIVLKSIFDSEKTEILIPNYICDSVYQAILNSGLKPILYDNKSNSWTSDFVNIKSNITDKTLAVLINHTFGIRMSDIQELKSCGIHIIEDCCHALTDSINGLEISKHSLCSIYSFDATKWIATGNGGAVATNNKELFKEMERIKLDEGLPDLLCSLGISQLNRIKEFIDKRYFIAQQYFDNMPYITKNLVKFDSIFFRFPILVPKINLNYFLNNNKVAFRRGVDEILSEKHGGVGKLENSKDVFERTISIPIYPSLKQSEINIIINETKRCFYESRNVR